MFDKVHQVIVDLLVIGIDDPIQVRKISIQIDIVRVRSTG